jgi:SanA protein
MALMSARFTKLGFIAILLAVLACETVVLGMRLSVAPYTYTSLGGIPHAHVAIVPGASVVAGRPSPVLAERADAAEALYAAGTVDLIFITGDNRQPSHNEVDPVRTYLIAKGVPADVLLLDRDGLDTYTSMFHAREHFGTSSVIVVTQDFHMPRALWIARELGLEARGVDAGTNGGSLYDYLREVPASVKAILDILSRRRS